MAKVQLKYLIVKNDYTGSEEFCKLFGDEGWEVIFSFVTQDAVHYIMRPPLPPPKTASQNAKTDSGLIVPDEDRNLIVPPRFKRPGGPKNA